MPMSYTDCGIVGASTPAPVTRSDCGSSVSLKDGDLFVGQCESVSRIRAIIARLARSNATTLIQGDTGTGKEIVALLLHRNSPRSHKPLIPINCAAIPEALIEGELFGYEKGAFSSAVRSYPGKFRLADGGTLFLDELGELSLAAQAKILRAIESGEVFPLGSHRPVKCSVRIIAATNRDLLREVEAGRFRADLYYRLAVAQIRIPPLVERPSDIILIANALLTQLCEDLVQPRPGLSPDFQIALERHDWPGNVREMRNAIEHALVTCLDPLLLTTADLPETILPPVDIPRPERVPTPPSSIKDERSLLLRALEAAGGRKAIAARALNCSRMTLYRRLERAGLSTQI